jgi:4-diphosphocytidyl-2-C-methyl-D-erythritol kinase
MRAEAYAKINIALAVFPPSADGFHPLRGIFQSVSLADIVDLSLASEDHISVSNLEAPSDESNLAWRAFDAARRAARIGQPGHVAIQKRIPAGAGLGGGSADAAAVLGMAADRFKLERDDVVDIAEELGSDVPFSFVGGSCLAEGRGERLTQLEPLTGFAIAVVVPPFAMETPAVYARWDALGGPEGEKIVDAHLPPSLRGGLPMRNDLYPAAVSLDERIGDWRADLSRRWGTSVAMTGSGSALFAFFGDMDEAASAAASVDVPARLAVAAEPVDRGWRRIDE